MKRSHSKSDRAKQAVLQPTTLRTWITRRRPAILLTASVLGAAFLAALLFLLHRNSKRDALDEKRRGVIASDLQPSVAERMPFPLPPPASEPLQPTFEDFVGSERCADCHGEQYRLWRKSTHGRAGGLPNRDFVIGRFDGRPLQFEDALVVPSVGRDGEYRFTVNAQDAAPVVFKVDAVIGRGHLLGGGTQSYFSEFPDGTLRFLPFDFIRDEQVWFCQVRNGNEWMPVNRNMSLDDLRQWPPSRILGTEASFSNCQNCHASQVHIRYDPHRERYVTRYQSLDINCESCHGPGKRHIEVVRSSRGRDLEDIGMKSLATLAKDKSLEICLQCHAVKDALDSDYLPGMTLENHYSLKLPILAESPYLADGRIRGFAYQENHLYSDCYLNGSMTCVDCHDPHSQNYRDINGTTLESRFDNRQCVACHASKAAAAESHSHHSPGSPANACTSCHMPYLQHRDVGRHLRFARADHSISIPRPSFDASLGIANACSTPAACHQGKDVAWLEAKTRDWHGEFKPHKGIVTELLQAQNIADRTTAARLLLHPDAAHPMAQTAGLSHLVKNMLQPDMPNLEAEIVDRLKQLCQEEDIDLQALAFMSLHYSLGHNPRIRSFLLAKVQILGEKALPVRTRWAMALDYLGSLYATAGDFVNAIASHAKAIEIKPDDALTYINLGNAYGGKGDIDRAIAAFEKAIALDSSNSMAYANLGTAYTRKPDFAKAVRSYRQAIRLKPSEPSNHLLLARLFANIGQVEAAVATLKSGLNNIPYDSNLRWFLQEIESLQQ